MFSKLFNSNGNYNILIKSLNSEEKVSVFGVQNGEKFAILNSVNKFILFVVSSEKEGEEFLRKFEQLGLKTKFLKSDFSFDLGFKDETFAESYNSLELFKDGEIDVLIITPNLLTFKLPKPAENLKSLKFEVDESCDLSETISQLSLLGYERTLSVENKGQFSVKGEIMDIYPFSENTAYRITFAFDSVESIRKIDMVSMLGVESVDNLTIKTVKPIEFDEEKLVSHLNSYKNKSVDIKETINRAMSLIDLKNYENNYWYATFKELALIWDFLPDNAIVCFSDAKLVYDEILEQINNRNNTITGLIKDGQLLKVHENLKVKIDEILNIKNGISLCAFQHISNANRLFSPTRVFNFKTLPYVDYSKNSSVLSFDLNSFLKQGFTTILYCKSAEGVNRIIDKINKNIPVNIAQTLSQVQSKSVNLIPRFFPASFSFVDEKVVVIGSEELFGVVKPKQNVDFAFKDAFLPEAGDIVVHQIHGIGKCLGVKSFNFSNATRDYVVVEYKNSDKLYLPVENIDSLSKYVGSDKVPALSKLGSNEFTNVKNKVKSGLKAMAFDLIKLYAEREKLKGYKYPADDEMQKEFEDSFGFEATPDQIRAVDEIKADMESGKLMDRLVCGDVGFGKTEVALRCAFKTICAGKKVAFLCPTTILSEQHYNTAMMRMKNFGVRIEVLNRFRSKKDENAILKDLEEGKIDLLVGTHKLLSKKVNIKNLGLLILDEEQKFGVEDKEKIKHLKKNINVLTLSATPIPRTLHISMVGIRDMSVIETPPISRIPTYVQVTEYSDFLVQNAIERELDRDGQVLVVYNRVESIYNFTAKLKTLVGDKAKIGVAHGQMEEKELEDAIFRLYNKDINVLVATSLIENGVDLPDANTLIVINADMLGLSQLYQLKGRIGRSNRQAYAYFTYDGRKTLADNAYKRLQAISEFTTMGSGFKIALRDLEIRGAGNVLGKEQHGHMAKVGYAMYVSLLNQAVAEVKGEKVERKGEVRVETNISAYIPQMYIANEQNRVAEYIEIAKIDSMEKMQIELKRLENIYGEVPSEITSLCKIAFIKNIASRIGAEMVCIKSGEVCIQFEKTEDVLNKEVSEVVSNFSKFAVLKLENKPTIEINIQAGLKDKLDFLLNFMGNFAN